MKKRIRLIRHSPVLLLLLLVACQGDPKRMEIAYGVFRNDVPTRIVVVEDDGSDVRRVTGARRGFPPVLPRWSPDGQRLAFVRFNPAGGPGALQVYVVNADGSGERLLGEGTQPQWTNDGRFVVVERLRAQPKSSTMHVLAVDGSGERRLAAGSSPVISNRGSRVAFVRLVYERNAEGGYSVSRSSLHTIGLDGTGPRRLAQTKGQFRQPSWLPDDSALAVIRGGLGGQLLTISPNGRRRVVAREVGETYDWSPKGDLVAYTHGGILFIIRPDGTEVESYGQSNAIDIEWSPDGTKVAYSVQEVAQTDVEMVGLYTIDVEKGERRRFALAEGLVAFLNWRPMPQDDD